MAVETPVAPVTPEAPTAPVPPAVAETVLTAPAAAPAPADAAPVTPAAVDTPVEGAPAGEAPAPVVDAPVVYDLKLPEGSLLNPTTLEAYTAEARSLGLTSEEAQAMVERQSALVAETANALLADLKADPALGGQHFDETVAAAAKGRDFIAPPGTPGAELLSNLLNSTGLGNHKLLVEMFARIGRMGSEDGLVGVGMSGAGATRSAEEILYGKTS